MKYTKKWIVVPYDPVLDINKKSTNIDNELTSTLKDKNNYPTNILKNYNHILNKNYSHHHSIIPTIDKVNNTVNFDIPETKQEENDILEEILDVVKDIKKRKRREATPLSNSITKSKHKGILTRSIHKKNKSLNETPIVSRNNETNIIENERLSNKLNFDKETEQLNNFDSSPEPSNAQDFSKKIVKKQEINQKRPIAKKSTLANKNQKGLGWIVY